MIPRLERLAKPDLAARLKAAEGVLRRRLERRETLRDVVRALSSTTEPAEIARLTIERLASWIPAPSWAVVSFDLSGQVSVLAERGVGAEFVRDVHLTAGWTMHWGKPFITANLGMDARVSSESRVTVMAFPLSRMGGSIGAVIGIDPSPSAGAPRLARATRAALEALLEPVAASLNNAVLLKRAEALSVTDDLTGLYNSRYLNQVLRREIKRAVRSGRPLSLLFVDLDGFKSINDTHGHLAGSRALIEAGLVIRASARETDVVARFGGDEFALVLPDTGARGAVAVAERIRERIAIHPFLAVEGLSLHLTVSVGIATLPDAAHSADALVEAADSAMYQVKHHGKNGIQAASVPTDK